MPKMKTIIRLILVLFVASLSPVSADAQEMADTLETAVVNATRLVFVTKKDTVVYNLDATNRTRISLMIVFILGMVMACRPLAAVGKN